jgi:hypothetical protein
MAFYEPLSERLAEITVVGMPTIRPEIWDSGHPDRQRPYFEEFAPLLSATERGVAGYQSAFAIEEYFAGSGAALPELAAYLESLVRLARSAGKTPVLKFCRSLGRVGWMRAAFPAAIHAVVVRSPWDQWLSAWHQYVTYGNPYFVVMPFVIMSRHHDHPAVARAAEIMKLHLTYTAGPSFEERYEA